MDFLNQEGHIKPFGSSVQNFRPVGELEDAILLLVSRALTKKSRRTFFIFEWSLDEFGHQE